MIKIKGLTKHYGQNIVYNNFNLSLSEGKITCILGESGCGKTTLLNCIARLTDFEGEIPKLKCSYIFQSPRLVPNLTVYNNLYLICKDREKIESILNEVKLFEKRNSYPLKLSGGEKQRVSIARAFLYGGDVLLMDEPFSALDLKLKKEISELFKDMLNERRTTALMVTHNIDEALELGDRILVIAKGGNILFDSDKEGFYNISEASDAVRKLLVSALLTQ